MVIMSKEELMLSLITSIMARGDGALYGTLDPHGTIRVQGGTSKVKGQYMRTAWAIPHEILDEKRKQDISIIRSSFMPPMAAIPFYHLNEKGRRLRKDSSEKYKKWAGTTPRIAAALNELMEALLEESKRMKESENESKSSASLVEKAMEICDKALLEQEGSGDAK